MRSYRKKRDFRSTSEPSGRERRRSGRGFVVQKHDASRLHYDFRLELGGVLKSWAVPKGPSLRPSQRRLAVQVEDHPVEYGGFEGVIPEGEYGGGAVLVWDRGEWIPDGDPAAAYRKGKLKFRLEGEKLRGRWTLVRMRSADDGRDNWLLIKEKDDQARTGRSRDILEERPESVLSGRSLQGVARERDRVWSSGRGEAEVFPASTPGAREAGLPATLAPQLATLVAEPPSGKGWLHEVKLDGYRLVARLEKGRATLLTRRGKDWSSRFPAVREAVAALPAGRALLDGEVVVFRPDGKTDFQRLQNWLQRSAVGNDLVYVAFDLLHLNGYDLRKAPLEERKRLLRRLLAASDRPALRYGDHLDTDGKKVYRRACELGLEGIVSKRRDRPYLSRRSRDWLKVKCARAQEFVIGGFTDPKGKRTGFGALLLGIHQQGELRYAGRVGTGFSEQTLQLLSAELERLERKRTPFAGGLTRAEARGVHWVTPKLVAEVEFSEWTDENRLRHPTFKGVRRDKEPAEIVREQAGVLPESGRTREEKNGMKSTSESSLAGVRLSNPGRVLYPEQGVTKRELAEFYLGLAEYILPHLANRPLTLVRCPRGRGRECFFQKHADKSFGDAVKRVSIEESDGSGRYLYVNSIEGVVSLVQLGVLEFHTWGCRIDRVERPDRVIFDLDPDPSLPRERVVEAARVLHQHLAELGLKAFLKATGGKGLHLVAPLDRRHGWDEVKEFARAVAGQLAEAAPERFTEVASKREREGKVYVDYLRNGRGATAVAAYSTRARENAPVAVPLAWDELSASVVGGRYTVSNLKRRLAGLGRDPWQGYGRVRQSITQEMKRAVRL